MELSLLLFCSLCIDEFFHSNDLCFHENSIELWTRAQAIARWFMWTLKLRARSIVIKFTHERALVKFSLPAYAPNAPLCFLSGSRWMCRNFPFVAQLPIRPDTNDGYLCSVDASARCLWRLNDVEHIFSLEAGASQFVNVPINSGVLL